MTCLDTIFSRTSIRMFKSELVPREVIEKILEAGIRAPNAGGAEQWYFIVVTSEEKRRKIHELLKEAHIYYFTRVLENPLSEEKIKKLITRMESGLYAAPVYIAGYIDLRRTTCRVEYRELERVWMHQSIAAAFENMLVAAWSMGLAGVWLGVPVLMVEKFNEVLEPPEGLELAGILALGYPAEETRPRRRRPLNEVVKYL